MQNNNKKKFISKVYVKCRNMFRWMFFPDPISSDVVCAISDRVYIVLPKSNKYYDHWIDFSLVPDSRRKNIDSKLFQYSDIWHVDNIYMYVYRFLGQGNFTFLFTTMLS